MYSYSFKISILFFFFGLSQYSINAQVNHDLQGKNVAQIELDDLDRPVVIAQFQMCSIQGAKMQCEEKRLPRLNAFEILPSDDLFLASPDGFFKKAFQDLIPIHAPMDIGFKQVNDLRQIDAITYLATDNGVWQYSDGLKKMQIKQDYRDVNNTHLLQIDKRLYSVVSNALINLIDSSEILILPNRIDCVFSESGFTLLGVEDKGLFIQTDEGFKKHFNPTIELGKHIKNIQGNTFNTVIHSEKGMFRWHMASGEITKIELPSDLYRYLINDIAVDRWGYLHVASANGLYRFNIDPTLKKDLPLSIPNSLSILDHSDQVLKHKKQQINISEQDELLKVNAGFYHPSNELKLQYQYSSSTWKDHPANQTIVLTNINAGKSELKIRASADNERFSNPLKLQIIKPGKSPWLNLLPFLGIGILILGFSWYSYQRQGRANKDILAQRDKLKLENEKLKLERKTLQLQMNPHFLFNALNSIQGLIALGDNKNARKQLGTFSTMMRTVLNQSRTEWIRMEDEIKFLNQYLSLEQMCRDNTFDFSIESDVEDDLKIPPMMVQAFVENAIIHGVSPLDSQGYINVVYTQREEFVECIIEDNGIGRHSAKAKKSSSHKPVALDLINERLQQGFKNKNKTYVQFTDKQTNEGKSLGTKVTVQLPVS